MGFFSDLNLGKNDVKLGEFNSDLRNLYADDGKLSQEDKDTFTDKWIGQVSAKGYTLRNRWFLTNDMNQLLAAASDGSLDETDNLDCFSESEQETIRNLGNAPLKDRIEKLVKEEIPELLSPGLVIREGKIKAKVDELYHALTHQSFTKKDRMEVLLGFVEGGNPEVTSSLAKLCSYHPNVVLMLVHLLSSSDPVASSNDLENILEIALRVSEEGKGEAAASILRRNIHHLRRVLLSVLSSSEDGPSICHRALEVGLISGENDSELVEALWNRKKRGNPEDLPGIVKSLVAIGRASTGYKIQTRIVVYLKNIMEGKDLDPDNVALVITTYLEGDGKEAAGRAKSVEDALTRLREESRQGYSDNLIDVPLISEREIGDLKERWSVINIEGLHVYKDAFDYLVDRLSDMSQAGDVDKLGRLAAQMSGVEYDRYPPEVREVLEKVRNRAYEYYFAKALRWAQEQAMKGKLSARNARTITGNIVRSARDARLDPDLAAAYDFSRAAVLRERAPLLDSWAADGDTVRVAPNTFDRQWNVYQDKLLAAPDVAENRAEAVRAVRRWAD